MFTTIPGSIATLFSLLNGDIIRDTFTDVGDLVPFWGHLYLYSFLCLFIYVVLHIFISIVEESYFTARRHSDDEPPVDIFSEIEVTETTPLGVQLLEPSHKTGIEQYVLGKIRDDISVLRMSPGWPGFRAEIDSYLR